MRRKRATMERYFVDLTDKELEKKINDLGVWDTELLYELCYRAGLEDEWNASDEETFEEVAYKAAEILGLSI